MSAKKTKLRRAWGPMSKAARERMSNAQKLLWANKTPEERAEFGRKVRETRRKNFYEPQT